MSTDTDESESLSDEEQAEIIQEVERRRTLQGIAVILVALVGISFSAFQLWLAARSYEIAVTLPVVGEYQLTSLQQLQVNAIHVTFALVLAFLLFPTTRGDGFVSRRLARLEPATRDRFGADAAATRLVERLGDGVRWAVVDTDMNRITPVDCCLAVLSVLPALYILTEFEEIQTIAFQRFRPTRPVQEVYPILEPVVTVVAAAGIPIDGVSYAYLLGVLGLLLVLEATRRTLGFILMSLVGFFIVYAKWGHFVPRDSVVGALSVQPETWTEIVYNLWYTVEAGVFSTPVTVSVRFIYIFILFGAFLEMSGAGKWFIDLAYSLTGTRKGGPAKASTVSSGFMGMLSGSSIANTVTTGAFTIPLMKRSGYTPSFSGAVESAASSGGQMLPPVMGAAAFLIVEFTGTPYPDVIIAATLPAIAFFFGMWVMVHFEAMRAGIGGLPREQLPDLRSHVRSGWFYLAPLALLLYFLIVARLSINRAGWYTIVAVVALIAALTAYDERTRLPLFGGIAALSLVQFGAFAVYGGGVLEALGAVATGQSAGGALSLGSAATAAAADLGTITILISVAVMLARPGIDSPLLELDDSVETTIQRSTQVLDRPALASKAWYRFGGFVLKSMESGARTATTVVIAVAAAGVIPGVISISGLGPNLAALISSVSGDSMLLLLVLTGVAAIIFGMGMPTTVMYIILVAMLETPIARGTGIAILAVHLYILYFGLMADVTPPVAVAAFAGAGVAKADEFKTATTAFLLSLNKILVPFAFVFSPGILLLRDQTSGWGVIGWSDVVDPGFFLPSVVVPVLGMFLGVYALGATIIGYQYSPVGPTARGLYSLASILLMVPELLLLVVEALLGLAGIPSFLTIFAITFPLRLVGLGLLVGLSLRNRSGTAGEIDSSIAGAATGDAD
ncbi:TRAP transporter permease [Halostagnicola kamekurae]|uniref:TRAP transporter, 4TM/12TM fusion protein n=1 Tax=Halostagnicola kamekurae TaxID=619731 RepID=A0A1I6SBQ0_9EURY|nr:TRAP transporter fused permease subunit [Halostagnicola kamekurae]SFS74300.1 TRAP transporter, 4TM/12TM fusion protein [Halostagnicola kamekurae]